MISPKTLLCALLAAGSGLFLYTKKHDTLVLEQKITHIVKDTRQIQEQTAMLRTQWALLNQPDRLSALTARIIPTLHSIDPAQFAKLSNITDRLPPVSSRTVNLSSLPSHNTNFKSLHTETVAHNISRSEERHHNEKPSPTGHSLTRTLHSTSSLERSLALLNKEDQTPIGHHHSYHDTSSTTHEGHFHTAPTNRLSSQPAQTETISWHPQTTHRPFPPHRDHTRQNSETQGVLPPPVPFSNE